MDNNILVAVLISAVVLIGLSLLAELFNLKRSYALLSKQFADYKKKYPEPVPGGTVIGNSLRRIVLSDSIRQLERLRDENKLLKDRLDNMHFMRQREAEQHTTAIAKLNNDYSDLQIMYDVVTDTNLKLRKQVAAYEAHWVD